MKIRNLLLLALALSLTLPVAACGDDGGEDVFECTAANSMCWVISVPATFSATPVSLYVTGFTMFPPTGMPGAMFNPVANPAIDANLPLEFEQTNIDQAGFTGNLYLAIALLVQGGGTTSPVEGIDWVGAMATPVNFDGAAKNIPAIEIALYDDPGTP
jgi:hypothetical protein